MVVGQFISLFLLNYMSDKQIERVIVDNYKEHLYHDTYQKDCSSCHKKKDEAIDGILRLARHEKLVEEAESRDRDLAEGWIPFK